MAGAWIALVSQSLMYLVELAADENDEFGVTPVVFTGLVLWTIAASTRTPIAPRGAGFAIRFAAVADSSASRAPAPTIRADRRAASFLPVASVPVSGSDDA